MPVRKFVVFFKDKPENDIPPTLPKNTTFIDNLADLVPEETLLLILNAPKENIWSLIKQIRKMEKAKLLPLFYLNEPEGDVLGVLDGAFSNKAVSQAQDIEKRIAEINSSSLLSPQEKGLLEYMYTRPNFILEGSIDYNTTSGFNYPLIRLLIENEQLNDWDLLHEMAKNGFLEAIHAKGELQVCAKCHSLAVAGKEILHCNHCKSALIMGSLPPQTISCPYCDAQLSNILREDETANQHAFFCLDCKISLQSTELITKKCFSYALAETGKKLVQGFSEKCFYIISRNNPSVSGFEQKIIHDLNALPLRNCYAVVVDLSEENGIQLAKELRKKPYYALVPLFYLTPPQDENEKSYFDGPFDSAASLVAEEINRKISLLPSSIPSSSEPEHLLLNYLFTRIAGLLQPNLSYQVKTGFHYPLVDLLVTESQFDSWAFLNDMANRNLLDQEKIIAEIQACIHCDSGLLNFSNHCPHCSSLNMREEKFIHCFTCGNMGPIKDFMHFEQLRCTRCHTRLKHIGIDYDKPLEDKLCLDCNYAFFEAETLAHCLVCHKQIPPPELKSKKLYAYKLAARGINLAMGEEALFKNLEYPFKFIELSSFMTLVNWNIDLARRSKEYNFSLLGLRIINQEELVLKLGVLQTEKRVCLFFEKLREIFRKSDVCTKDEQFLLFLLPMADRKASQQLILKIKQFLQKQETALPIKVEMSMLVSDQIIQLSLQDELLLTELQERAVHG